VRQLLTESLFLSAVGGLIGVGLAWLGVGALASRLGEAIGTGGSRGLTYMDPSSVSVDPGILAFALFLTLGVGIGLGVLPALELSGTSPIRALKDGRATSRLLSRMGGAVGRNGMISIQIAVALVLLVGASQMVKSLVALQQVDLGFDPENLLTGVYSLTPADEAAGLEPGLLHTGFAERVRALPGVSGVALGTVPMGEPIWTTIISGSDGDPGITPGLHIWMQLQPVDGGHVGVLGGHLLEGRDIQAADDWNARRVVVLNRSAATRLFPEGHALGQRIRFGWPGYGSPGATVVGIVEDIQLGAPSASIPFQGFVSVRQAPRLETGIMVRTEGDPMDLIPSLRRVLGEIAPNIPLTSVMTMQERASAISARSRMVTTILGLFGAVSLVLVAVGLYGMISFTVSRRTRELGLRASLGAGRTALTGLVLKEGVSVAAVGIGLGAGTSLYATRFLQSLIVGTPPVNPALMVAVALGLFLVSTAAAYVPARRAARIDPMEALRPD